MMADNYKYGFKLTEDSGNYYLSNVLSSPIQGAFITDQDYIFDINTAYVSEIITINSVKVDKLTDPCKGDVSSTLTLYPSPGLNLVVSGTATFTASVADATNVSEYYFEHERAGVVLGIVTGVSVIDATVDFTGVVVGDTIRGGATLTNGVKFYKNFDIVSTAGSPWGGLTTGERVDDTAAYTMNTSRDQILLTDTTWAASDGPWSVAVTVNYIDPLGATKELTYTKCVLIDTSTDIGCKVYDSLTGDTNKDLAILAQYEAFKLALECHECCAACTIWSNLLSMVNNANCDC